MRPCRDLVLRVDRHCKRFNRREVQAIELAKMPVRYPPRAPSRCGTLSDQTTRSGTMIASETDVIVAHVGE